jgi:hypothetical protein
MPLLLYPRGQGYKQDTKSVTTMIPTWTLSLTYLIYKIYV